MKFKVGDKVKVMYSEDNDSTVGKIGVIRVINDAESIGLEFNEEIDGGHDLFDKSLKCKHGYGWHVVEREIVLVERKQGKDNQESFIIETQPHIETKLYTYQDGTSDIANVNIEADTKKVIYSGTTTIVILSDGSKGVAKTSPDDEFDKKKGYSIALRRAYLKRVQKELKELTK